MKKLLQYITLFCCACIPATLGSCSSDLMSDDVAYSATEVGGVVDLSLNVRIGNTTGVRPTRDGEESDDKFTFEQSDDEYELIKTLRVIIVRADNTVEYNRTISLGKAAAKLSPEDENEKSLENDLKFRVSTDLGRVDTEAMTSTERKRIYLIANEAALNNFRSNMAGEGQKITEILDGIKAAHYLSTPEAGKEETRHRGDRLDPFSVEKWIIYNEWPGGVDTPGEMAVPIIDNTGDTKSYIPMTEYFDVDVVSTWKPADKADGEEDTDDESVVNIAKQNVDLFVTRNFVKFQFSAYSETEAFDITAIRFYKLMQKEYLFPFNTVYDPPKAINDTENRQIISFQTPGFADNFLRPYIFNEDGSALLSYIPSKTEGETGDETEDETGEETGGKPAVKIEPVVYSPALYFCETNNIVSTETNLQEFKVGIDVTYKKLRADGTYEALDQVSYGATLDDAVQLKNLPYSLPRNTIVKVDMRLKDRKLAAVATVYPYTAVTLNPEFGFAPSPTSSLTVAPTMELDMNDPEHREGLLYATYTSTPALTDDESKNFKLIWVSSDPSIILLGPEHNDPDPESQLYVRPAESIELSLKDGNPVEAVPVRIIPQKTGTTYVTAYSQTGLVARCQVTVK